MTRRPADPEEELRWMSQEVRGYVEAVLNSLATNVPKVKLAPVCYSHSFGLLPKKTFHGFCEWKQAVVLCQVEKAKEVNNDEVEFRLQLSALTKSIPLNSSAFKGLSVDVYQEGGYYKYTYGKTASYDEIVRLKNRISDKFPNAMIIAFMGGRKVSVAEARKNQK